VVNNAMALASNMWQLASDLLHFSLGKTIYSDGARMSRQPGHWRVSKVMRQIISYEGQNGLRMRSVSTEGSEITSS